jgi:hypothetical protein
MPDPVDLLAECQTLPVLPQEVRQPIQRLRYSHESMIEMIVADPAIHQNELARRFGMTASWISTVVNSDAFQVMLHKRMGEVWGELSVSMKDQLQGLMARSMEILRAKLDSHHDAIPDQLALRTLELTSRAAGYGARDASTTVNVNVTQKLDDNADQLVNLLRRKKAQVLEGESTTIDIGDDR